MPAFTDLAELAAARVGGKALFANDEFFAPKENLLRPGRGEFIPGKFTPRGKWMDGWETRRRRTPGYDWCVIQLGMPGVVRGVDVDTNHFIGNFPERCSLEACFRPGRVVESRSPRPQDQLGGDPPSQAPPGRLAEPLPRRQRSALDPPPSQHLPRRRGCALPGLRRGRAGLAGARTVEAAPRPRLHQERRPRPGRERHALRREGQPHHARPFRRTWATAGRPGGAAAPATTG